MAQLLAAISHELRTPLTAVLGFCDLMGREVFGPVGDPRYSAYLRHIADGGAALLKSTEDTLALTALLAERTESVGAPSQVRLRPLIDEAVDIHAAHASCRRVSVGIEVSDAPTARIDSRTCRQVLANLIGEAVERTADGGCVQIVVHCVGDIVQLRLTADPAEGPLGDAPLAQAMARDLFARGVHVSGFFFPVVPKGQARIRTQMNARLTRDDMDFALDAFRAAGRATGVLA